MDIIIGYFLTNFEWWLFEIKTLIITVIIIIIII